LPSIFKEAEKILVLDKSFMLASTQVGTKEVSMIILCSAWARRLWTFHGSAFGKSVHFQFLDRNIRRDDILDCWKRETDQGIAQERETIDELMQRGNTLSALARPRVLTNADWHINTLGWDDIFTTAYRWLELLQGDQITKREVSDKHKLAYLLQVFGWRNTANPEDEATCLAALLGQNTKEMTAMKGQDERMGGLLVSFSAFLLDFRKTLFEDRSQTEDNRIQVDMGAQIWIVFFTDDSIGDMGIGSDKVPDQSSSDQDTVSKATSKWERFRYTS
jgi:hypothetical protein